MLILLIQNINEIDFTIKQWRNDDEEIFDTNLLLAYGIGNGRMWK
jgi:hypothetical protein